MPYLKLATLDDLVDVRSFCRKQARKNHGYFPGLVLHIPDPQLGRILFLSEKPYMEEIVKETIKYELIPKDQISEDWRKILREAYPDFLEEL